MTTPVTQTAYPPLDSQATETFIDNSGVTKTGDVQTDFRNALYAALGYTNGVSKYSIDDLWRRYVQNVLHADANKVHNWITISDPPRGQHPAITHSLPFLVNTGNANGFPTAGNFHPWNLGPIDALVMPAGLNDPISVQMSPDGSRLFSLDHSAGNFFPFIQVDMATNYSVFPADATAWTEDANTARVVADAGDVILLSEDGTKMYAMGESNFTINQYNMSTAYDVSTISAATPDATHTIPAYGGPSNIKAAKWGDDGNYLFLYSGTPAGIYRFSMSTPYDLSTLSWDGASYNVTLASDGFPIANSITFSISADGKWFMNPYSGNNGVWAMMELETPWDTSGNFTVYALETNTKNWASDGSGAVGDVIHVNDDAYCIFQINDVPADETFVLLEDFGSDAYITQYGFHSSWNPPGSYDTQAVFWNSDGTKIVTFQDAGSYFMDQWDLSVAYDLSTVGGTPATQVALGSGDRARGVFVHPDGDEVWFGDSVDDQVRYFSLSTPWDFSTASARSTITPGASMSTLNARCPYFTPDGLKFFLYDADNTTLQSIDLSVAYDITTGTNLKTLDLSVAMNTPGGAYTFNDDGTKLICQEVAAPFASLDHLVQYNLSTAWDLSTASFSRQRCVYNQGNGNTGAMVYHKEGSDEYITTCTGTTSDLVRKFKRLSTDSAY